ncbi:MAG: hypothetical protein ACLFUH_09835 [Bacteroidales bacterium]
MTRKTLTVKEDTYKEFVKLGDASDTYEDIIKKLIKIAKKHDELGG